MSKSRKIEITIETHKITRTHQHRPVMAADAERSEAGDAETAGAELERGHLLRAGVAEKVDETGPRTSASGQAEPTRFPSLFQRRKNS